MKIQEKKRIVQKLWGWACLTINCLIITLFLGKKDTDYLIRGVLLSLVILFYGVVKTSAAISKNDLSGLSVVIEYVCVYIITFLSALKVTAYISSVALLRSLIIASFVELLVFLIITYWHTIRNITCRKRKGG